jgi:hypothetical protein
MLDTHSLRELILATVKAAGSKAEFCRRMTTDTKTFDKKTLDSWTTSLGSPTPIRIHRCHVDRLFEVARELGLEVELFLPVAPIWKLTASYEDNRATPVAPPPSLEAALSHLHRKVPALGVTLRSPFGIAPSVLTSSLDRMIFFANAGCAVIFLKTLRSKPWQALPSPNMAVVLTQPDTVSTDPTQLSELIVTSPTTNPIATHCRAMTPSFGRVSFVRLVTSSVRAKY